MVVDFPDLVDMVQDYALASGIPNIRTVHSSRTLPGPADVDSFIEPMVEALIRPLTAKEKETGRWEPTQPRILFEGTLPEAQKFYQQTRKVSSPLLHGSVCVYTDGLPIIAPTEELVREMLTGTSHKPDELITRQSSVILTQRDTTLGEWIKGEKGEVAHFQSMGWTATVEKVATIAVMSGCKPEHLPVVLAISESECPTGTAGIASQWVCASGPIVKEIGINCEQGMFDPGNPANMPIGRAYQLMALNLGGAMVGVNRLNNFGSPFNSGGTLFAENMDALPPGWKGLNEEYGFKKDESIVMVITGGSLLKTGSFPSGGYRALQKSGHGGIARRLGVKGVPGPHNLLEYVAPGLWVGHEGGYTIIMIPVIAHDLYEYGFKTKDEIYQWLWKQSFEPLKDYKLRAGPDLSTNGWMGIERTSGKHWKELPDDYMVPVGGNNPTDNCIIVAGGPSEHILLLNGRRGLTSSVYSVDAWR